MTSEEISGLPGMRAILNDARSRRLWLYCSYQGLWFSPDELEARMAQGHFRRGVVNWQLRDPKEELASLERAARSAELEVAAFRKRVGA